MLSCGAARKALWPESMPRAVDARILAARSHVEACAECRAFLTGMETLRSAVRGAARELVAPQEVRERTFASLAEARAARGYSRLSLRVFAVAAAVGAAAVIAVVTLPWLTPKVRPGIAAALAQRHAAALGGDRVTTSNPETVKRWVAARLTFAVFVPVFSEARLAGARIDVSDRGRGAVIEYHLGDAVISYFVIPDENGFAGNRRVFRHADASGYRAVLWSDAGLLHAMIGAVPSRVLERLARECVRQMHQQGVVALGRIPDLRASLGT